MEKRNLTKNEKNAINYLKSQLKSWEDNDLRAENIAYKRTIKDLEKEIKAWQKVACILGVGIAIVSSMLWLKIIWG